MNKLISDHEDEKVDELIGKVLNERAKKINVPDGMKEEIDERIGRTYTMRKNVNKKMRKSLKCTKMLFQWFM